MLNNKLNLAINKQINAELFSAYLYLSMSSYFEQKSLTGFAKWMYAQYQEELTHAMKFFQYVHAKNSNVLLDQIDKPPSEWDSPLAVFEYTLKHEENVTDLINKLVDLSIAENDHATHSMLRWFIDEQVEEEASAEVIVNQLKLIGDSSSGLFLLDKELATMAEMKVANMAN